LLSELGRRPRGRTWVRIPADGPPRRVEIKKAESGIDSAFYELEEIGFGHRQTSEEDSESGESTIIDTRHPFFAT